MDVLICAGNPGALRGMLATMTLSSTTTSPDIEPEAQHCPQGGDATRKVEDAGGERPKAYAYAA